MYDHKSIFFFKKTNGKGWHISLKENKQALHSAENCFHASSFVVARGSNILSRWEERACTQKFTIGPVLC
jgi:hypothetical protein